LWRSIRLDRVQWSARLEDLKDGSCIQFAGLDELAAHPWMRLDPEEPEDHSPSARSEGDTR
jgi:hypothetical protein